MQIHSLISSEYILLLHVEKNKMQPIQEKYGTAQFNYSSFFESLKIQNRNKCATRTGHGIDAQSHKNDILGIFSNPLQKSRCSHSFLQMLREALLIKAKSSYGQYSYVQSMSWLLRIKIISVHRALFMLSSFLWKPEYRKVGDNVCLDGAGTFDMCIWEYGRNRAWP